MDRQTAPFKNVLVFGAGGNSVGHQVLQALIADRTFAVTVLTRESSKTAFPSTISVKRIPDDFPHGELVSALRGQDVVISAITTLAQENEHKLIDAAIEAGVQRFIPSEWGTDNADVKNQELNPIFKAKSETASYLQSRESESFSWTAVATSIWLEWALGTNALGIDPKSREVQYWRDGTHEFSCTTLEYCGKAVVAMLKHREFGKNQRVFLSPFEASQRQIVAGLESLQNVKYAITHADDGRLVQEAQRGWREEKNVNFAYQLVSPGVLLPEFKAGFESSAKVPILEHAIDMPGLTLEHVLSEWK